jgi:PAS domain S-box-containing protein
VEGPPLDRLQQKNFRNIYEASPDPVVITRASDWRITLINRVFEEVSGYAPQEALGRTPLELGLWPDPAQIQRCVAMVQTQGQIRNLEMTLRFKSGDRPFLLSAATVRFNGEACFLTIARDISGLRKIQDDLLVTQAQLSLQISILEQTQKRLREESSAREQTVRQLAKSETTLRTIFNSSRDVIGISSLPDLRYIEVNEAFERVYGLQRADVIGRPAGEVMFGLSRSVLEGIGSKLAEDGFLTISNSRWPSRVKLAPCWCRQ